MKTSTFSSLALLAFTVSAAPIQDNNNALNKRCESNGVTDVCLTPGLGFRPRLELTTIPDPNGKNRVSKEDISKLFQESKNKGKVSERSSLGKRCEKKGMLNVCWTPQMEADSRRPRIEVPDDSRVGEPIDFSKNSKRDLDGGVQIEDHSPVKRCINGPGLAHVCWNPRLHDGKRPEVPPNSRVGSGDGFAPLDDQPKRREVGSIEDHSPVKRCINGPGLAHVCWSPRLHDGKRPEVPPNSKAGSGDGFAPLDDQPRKREAGSIERQ